MDPAWAAWVAPEVDAVAEAAVAAEWAAEGEPVVAAVPIWAEAGEPVAVVVAEWAAEAAVAECRRGRKSRP